MQHDFWIDGKLSPVKKASTQHFDEFQVIFTEPDPSELELVNSGEEEINDEDEDDLARDTESDIINDIFAEGDLGEKSDANFFGGSNQNARYCSEKITVPNFQPSDCHIQPGKQREAPTQTQALYAVQDIFNLLNPKQRK